MLRKQKNPTIKNNRLLIMPTKKVKTKQKKNKHADKLDFPGFAYNQ